MAEATDNAPKTPKPTTAKTPMNEGAGSATASMAPQPGSASNDGAGTSDKRTEAKSRFNAALEEAKAGAAALGAEAKERAGTYRTQAKTKGDDYTVQAKMKAGELAREGKTRASDALSTLGKMVADNAPTVDEKLGSKYGDYARSASRSLQETAARIDEKSVEELGEDAREFVRRSPGTAVGLAAVAGYFIARLFRSK
jgi:ElaB/YqjD/DUF883 family membrane-anchored ribosome-binding protein